MVFGSLNLHLAVAHEELAYALYVHEYSSGRFYLARYVLRFSLYRSYKVMIINFFLNNIFKSLLLVRFNFK